MKYVFVYCLGYIRLIMFLTSFFLCLVKLETSKYIISLVFASAFWCFSWDLAAWMFARWISPMVDAGHLGMETWCSQGWWLLPAHQRLLGHSAIASLEPGCSFWGGSQGFAHPGRKLVPPGVLFMATAPCKHIRCLLGCSAAAASWGAQLTKGLTFSAAAARRSQG